jgi:ribonuclease PH
MRIDGRKPDEIRPVKITPNFIKFAEGSVLMELGDTQVLCTATLDNHPAPHLIGTGKGWVTAEYDMLPCASTPRKMRDRVKGKIPGRSAEIQRLIGRCLRSVVEMDSLGERTFYIDCDVLQADGGTRTASVTGSFIALALAMKQQVEAGKLGRMFLKDFVAATSVGIVEGRGVLDLSYLEDSQAEVDMNVVMNGSGGLIEVQGTAESASFSREQLDELLNLAKTGIDRLIQIQKDVLGIDILPSKTGD